MLIILSFCLVEIQWKSECDDNKKADADTADNDNRITNMGQGERSGEQSEQEMSE